MHTYAALAIGFALVLFACNEGEFSGASRKNEKKAAEANTPALTGKDSPGKDAPGKDNAGTDASDKDGKDGKNDEAGDEGDGKEGKAGKDKDGKSGKNGKDETDDEAGKDGKDAKGGKPDEIVFDDTTIAGVKGTQASINFEDIPGGGDRDYNDLNLCMDGAVEPIFKVDVNARTIRLVKDASVVGKLNSGSCAQNTMIIEITHLDGKKTTLGPLTPKSQPTVTLNFKKGDALLVKMITNGNPSFQSTDPVQSRVTVGQCQLFGNGCGDNGDDED